MRRVIIMKAMLTVALCLLLGCGSAFGVDQPLDYDWVKTFGGTGADYGYSVAVDRSGNVYVTGMFGYPKDTADFDPGPGTDIRTSAGSWDIFLSKYDSSGNYQWTKTIGGSYNDQGISVAVDTSGNIYVTGMFYTSTVDFDPGPGTDNHTNAGYWDIFLSKYNSSGNYQWTKTVGGTNDDTPASATVDTSGNIYITGMFYSGTVDFDPGPGTDIHTNAGGWDIFLSKYDSSGNYQWTKTIGGSGLDHSCSGAVDRSGNVYIAGSFQYTVDFDPGPGTDKHTGAGGDDIFLSKYDSSGTYQWTKTFGGSDSGEGEYGESVADDRSGDVYVSGLFRGTVDFDPGPGTDEYTATGYYGFFLSKYDSSGNYQWTNAIVDPVTSNWGGFVVIDESRNVYHAGLFGGTADFDPGPGTDIHTSAGGDTFLSKYDSSGNYKWTKVIGGSGSCEHGYRSAIDESGNIYITGSFNGTTDFGRGPGADIHTCVGGVGGEDIFLLKLTGPFQSPTASASASPTSGRAPLGVTFTGTGTDTDGTIVKYEWDFDGDGTYDWSSPSSGNTTHTYSVAGTYNATLRVTDNDNLTGTDSVTITVSPAPKPPTATASASPTSGRAPLTVTFTGTGTDADGTITKYEWDFDGNGTYDWSSATTGNTSHTYTIAGTYQATLRVTDNDGLTGTGSVTITVSPALKPPTASASANPTTGLIPLTVNFTGTGTDSDGTITKYEWDFDGDGAYDWGSTTSGKTSHTYEEVGSYTAKLRVTDNDNLSDTDTVTITVQQPSELKVWISVPKDGDSIWGDEVTLRANTAPGELTKSVQFQYKASSAKTWINLGDPLIPPPYSFYTTWDVTSLTPGNYHLRAVATDTNNNLVYANSITLTVTSQNPKIWEGKNPRGDHEKKEKVSKDKTEVTEVFDRTTAQIAQGALATDSIVHTILYDATTTPVAIRRTRHIIPAGIYKEFNIAEGAYGFNRDITVTIPYPDVDNDGILDGTGIGETTLAIYHYNESTGLWERVIGSTIYLSENYVSAPVNQVSLFTLVGTTSIGGANAPSSGGGGGGGGGGGCLIATAAYETPMAEEERILCQFRDRHLLTNRGGRAFVSLYNKLSPPVARFIQDRESLKAMVRFGLRPLVWIARRTTK